MINDGVIMQYIPGCFKDEDEEADGDGDKLILVEPLHMPYKNYLNRSHMYLIQYLLLYPIS